MVVRGLPMLTAGGCVSNRLQRTGRQSTASGNTPAGAAVLRPDCDRGDTGGRGAVGSVRGVGVGAAPVLMLSCSEWYGYHFPELIKIVSENYTYCRLAKFIGNRKELSEESLEGLEEIVMDGAKAQAILEASRSSMGEWGSVQPVELLAELGSLTLLSAGMDISPIDLINIESFSSRVISLSEYRKGLQEYLRSKMSQVAPSLSALIGEVVSECVPSSPPRAVEVMSERICQSTEPLC